MRIIAGKLGGRLFDSPRSARTHPMSDKARGALFNILGDLDGLTVLDAFAGTGALGFEAVSRGAKAATLIELDKPAQKVIAANIRTLNIAGRVKLIAASASAWMQTNPNATFDIILCDPPYDDLQPNLITRLNQRVRSGGLLVLSWPGDQQVPNFKELEQVDSRSYGDLQLAFYRQIR